MADGQADGLDEYAHDDSLEDILYARHAEVKTFKDLENQRGTNIPALFNQLYKFVQNPSTVSVETFKRMVDTDDTIGSGVDFLTTCLAARLGRYTHPSAEVTEFVNKCLDELNGGQENMRKEILSASWAGFSVGEVVWSNKEHGFVPEKIVPLPASTILFETERTGEVCTDGILQYQRNYNPFLGGGVVSGLGMGFTGASTLRNDPFAKFGDFPFPLRTANAFNYLCIRIPRQKVIHYAFNAQGQFGNPYGRSLLRRIYKYYVVKDAVLQMKVIALDRKGTPLTIIYADPNTMVEDGEKNPDGSQSASMRGNKNAGISAAQAAKKAFQNVHNDSTIILPGKKDEIFGVDFMPQSPNTSDFIACEDFCNKSILRGLLLPSLIFGNGDGTGSFALGQEHAKTFDKICDSINAGLEHVLLQQLVKQIVAYNFPKSAWMKDGLGSFSKRTLSRDEISKEMEVVEKGVNSGAIDMNDMADLNKVREIMNFDPLTIEQFSARQAEKEAEKAAMQGGDLGGLEEGNSEDAEEAEEPSGAKAPAKGKEKAKGDRLARFTDTGWITTHGTHIHVDKAGQVDKGPAEVEGENAEGGDSQEGDKPQGKADSQPEGAAKQGVSRYTGSLSSQYIEADKTGKSIPENDALNEWLEKAPKYEGPVYRGMSVSQEDLHKLLETYKPGSEIELPAKQSFTKDKGFAEQRVKNVDAKQEGATVPVIIEYPKSSQGVDVSEHSRFPEEGEVVMPKGSKYKVISVNHAGGKVVVTLGEEGKAESESEKKSLWGRIKSLLLASERNYTVNAILHFDDGVNRGSLSVRAESEEDAKAVATARLCEIWGIASAKVEIKSVRKG